MFLNLVLMIEPEKRGLDMKTNGYYGAIIGDIVGGVFEDGRRARPDFPLFVQTKSFHG
jgi:hypothetical protein